MYVWRKVQRYTGTDWVHTTREKPNECLSPCLPIDKRSSVSYSSPPKKSIICFHTSFLLASRYEPHLHPTHKTSAATTQPDWLLFSFARLDSTCRMSILNIWHCQVFVPQYLCVQDCYCSGLWTSPAVWCRTTQSKISPRLFYSGRLLARTVDWCMQVCMDWLRFYSSSSRLVVAWFQHQSDWSVIQWGTLVGGT